MRDLIQGTVADLSTLMASPPHLRRGYTRLAKPVSPAPGATYAYKLEPSWWERVLTVGVTLTTAASTQVRSVSAAYTDGDGFAFASVPLLPVVLGSTTATGYGITGINRAAAAGTSAVAEGSVTDPGAFATIAQVTGLPAGVYSVTGTVYLSGTVTAADANNMVLTTGATPTAVIAYPGVANVPVTYSETVTVGAAGSVILQAISAASGAAAVYNGSLSVTSVNPAAQVSQLPDLVLRPGWSLALTVTNLQAGDQLSGLSVLAERYPSNWADGALTADTEAEIRRYLEWREQQDQGR